MAATGHFWIAQEPKGWGWEESKKQILPLLSFKIRKKILDSFDLVQAESGLLWGGLYGFVWLSPSAISFAFLHYLPVWYTLVAWMPGMGAHSWVVRVAAMGQWFRPQASWGAFNGKPWTIQISCTQPPHWDAVQLKSYSILSPAYHEDQLLAQTHQYWLEICPQGSMSTPLRLWPFQQPWLHPEQWFLALLDELQKNRQAKLYLELCINNGRNMAWCSILSFTLYITQKLHTHPQKFQECQLATASTNYSLSSHRPLEEMSKEYHSPCSLHPKAMIRTKRPLILCYWVLHMLNVLKWEQQ